MLVFLVVNRFQLVANEEQVFLFQTVVLRLHQRPDVIYYTLFFRISSKNWAMRQLELLERIKSAMERIQYFNGLA